MSCVNTDLVNNDSDISGYLQSLPESPGVSRAVETVVQTQLNLPAVNEDEIEALSGQIQTQLHIENSQTPTQIARIIKNTLHLDSAKFTKSTKKANQTSIGYAMHNGLTFLHFPNEIVGIGFIKKALTATTCDLHGNVTPIIRLKIKNRNTCRISNINLTIREAKLQQTFNHQNIVRVIDIHEYGAEIAPKVCIYVERCDSDLQKALEQQTLSLAEKTAVMIDIANALEYLHEKGYSHNDVKLDNIMLKGKQGKLGDFGLCFSNTGCNVFAGLAAILPPEKRDKKVQTPSCQTDVYQFGLVLQQVFQGIETDQINALIAECTASNPAERPTMTEVKTRLEQIKPTFAPVS